MELVYALLYCPQYRPLLVALAALVVLALFMAAWSGSPSHRKSHDQVRRSLAAYAGRFEDIQQTADDRRRQAAQSYVQDVKDILGGNRP